VYQIPGRVSPALVYPAGERPSPEPRTRPLHTILALSLCACEPVADTAPPTSPGDSGLETGETATPHSDPPCETGETAAETGETALDTGDTADTGDTGEPADPETMVEKLDPYNEPPVRFSPDPFVDGAKLTVTYEGSLVGSAKNLDFNYSLDDSSPSYDEAMTPTKLGFELTIDVPKGTLALHTSFEDPDSGDEDDFEEAGYHAAASFPYLGPWLHWSTTALPGDGIAVGWETTQPCLGVVEYGSTDALGSWAVGSYEDTVHHVDITGLTPGDTLHYRVWDSRGQVSDTFTYELPDTTAPHSFIAMADLQSYGLGGSLEHTASELVASHSDAAFALIAGDVVGTDDPAIWWVTLYELRNLVSAVPLVTVAGNREGNGGGFWAYDRYMAQPYASVDEPWYSLDFGTTHILALHSGDGSSLEEAGDQYAWIASDLAACWHGATRLCDAVFATWHVPPYNVGSRHFSEQFDLRLAAGLFDGNVDWHFSGHEHLYQRFEPLQHEATTAPSGDYGVGSDDGVGFVVLPPAGTGSSGSLIDPEDKQADVRDLLAFPSIAADATHHDGELGYLIVEVDTTGTTLSAWSLGSSTSATSPELLESVNNSR